MADRKVTWEAVANFTSLVAQSAKAEQSLKKLREEENRLATAFEADSARIAAASKAQNAAISDTNKSFADATKASKQNADNVVRDSKRRSSALEDEVTALNKVERAKRELEVSDKKRSDVGQRLAAIQQALAKANEDVAASTERTNKAADEFGKTSKQNIAAENDLISARRSNQRITAALAQAESERRKAIEEANKIEAKAAADEAKAAAAREKATQRSARAEQQLVTDRAAAARAAREVEAAELRVSRARASVASATTSAASAERQDTAETVRNGNSKKTFLQILQNIQSLQKTYKGTVTSVAAAETAHSRALQRNIAAQREVAAATSDLNRARSIEASSASTIEDATNRLNVAREIQSHAIEDVNKAEADLTKVRQESGSASRDAVAAENNLTAARRSYQRVSTTVSTIESEIGRARSESATASRVASDSEARLANARQRAQLTEAGLLRATTRLNGEMNASKSITRQVRNAFGSLSSIYSGMGDATKDLIGLFGKLALTLLPQLLPLVGALSGGFVALTSSLGPLTGFLGAIPGLLVGAVTGFAVLKGAFGGVSKALSAYNTEQAKAGEVATQTASTAKKNAKAIADAQRAVSDARKNAAEADKQAAENVKKAEADQVKASRDAAASISKAKEQAASDIERANEGVTQAEKDLAKAQIESKSAQEDLNNVRKEALQELEDMRKAARDASFSERDANLNLIDARNKLAQVKADPGASDSEVARAQLDYEEAQARLADAEEAKKKANQDNAEAQAKGIKGTQAYANAQDAAAAAAQKVADAQTALLQAQKEQVKTVADAAKAIAAAEQNAAEQRASAAQRVADAKKQQAKTETSGAESIRKAQENLASAQENAAAATKKNAASVNAYQTALNKLTPAQRQFVQFLIGLKPKLDQIRQTAAAGLLPGVEQGIKNLLPLFPAFNRSVGSTAKSLGDASAQIGKTLGSGEGLGAMQRVLKTNDGALKEAAGSSGHYTIALVRIMDAARPLVSWIGHLVAEFGKYLDKTTDVNKKNGDLARFFDSTKNAAKLFGGILKSIGGIIYGVGRAAKPAGDSLWNDFGKHLEKINEDLKDSKNQDKLKKWFLDIKPIVKDVGHIFGNLGRSIVSLTGGSNDKQGKGLQNLHDLLSGIANGIGPDSPLIKFFAKLNQNKNTGKALGSLFDAFTKFMNSGGATLFSVMATELNAIADAFKAIASNKAGAAIITGLMATAATVKVAKFVGTASGFTGTARVIKGARQRYKARRAGGAGAAVVDEATAGAPAAAETAGNTIGRTIDTGIAAGIRSNSSVVTSAITSILTGQSAITGKATSEGNTVGNAIATGVAAGIRSSNAEVDGAAKQMANGVITSMKTSLQIHSPSKVTTLIGENTGQGFVNGILANKIDAIKAAEQLEQATINAIKGTESRMLSAGETAGSAYARGLRNTKGQTTAASEAVSSSAVVGGGASRGAKIRGAVGSAGGAAMMGSMFLPGKAGEIAGQAGMALMLVSMLPKFETVKKVLGTITKALKLQAAAQWLVNFAMEANPIGLIIIGLVALGVALVVLWKKSETFRKIVTGAWDAIKAAAVATFNWFKNVGSTMFNFIKDAASSVFSWLKKNWPLILAILTAPFGGMYVYLAIKFWPQITGFLNKLWGWVKGAFAKVWSGVKAVLLAPFDAAKALISQFTDSKSGLRHIFSSVWSWFSNTFSRTWSGLQKIITAPISAARTAISSLLGKGKNGLQTVFSSALKGINTVWNGLKAIAVSPINFIRTKVFKGLANAYNWIVGKIPGAGNLKIKTDGDPFTPIKLANGGRVIGNSPSAKADNIPSMLTAGEWVQPVSTVKHYGADVMEAIRRKRIPREALSRFAGGGTVEGSESSVLRANKRKRRVAHLRDGGEAGVSGYSLGSLGGAAELSSYFDPSTNKTGDGVTSKGFSPPYRPGKLGALNQYLRALQAKYGVTVLEHQPFGPVHPVHMTGSLHYLGQAADVSGGRGWPGTGNDIFNGAILKGLGAIWQSAGHYDHVHIDTGLYSVYHDVTRKLGQGVLAGDTVATAGDEGNFITRTFSSLKDLLGGINPLGKLKGAITGPLKAIDTTSLFGKMMGSLVKAPLSIMVTALKNVFMGSEAYEGNATLDPALAKSLGFQGIAKQWTGTVKTALKMNGLPTTPAYVNAWLHQIQTESSGNPSAIQGSGVKDINYLRGDLAKGLVQVISSTFDAYHFKGHNNIFNGLDNLLAGINYAKHAYGVAGMLRAIGHGHGYSEGGYTGSGYKYEPAGVVHKGEVVWSQKDVAAHGGAAKVDSMRKWRGSKLPGYATGGIVAPPDGKPIRGIQPGLHMMAWKMIRQMLGLHTVRGMKSPWPDLWDSSVSKSFAKLNYTVPDLSSITKAVSVSKLLTPVVNWMRYTQSRLPGRSQMEGYDTVGPTNYKSHPALTRIVQKIIGIKQDSVWGSNMSKAYLQWRRDKGLPMVSPTTRKSHNYVTGSDWKWLAEEAAPWSYGAKTHYTDKNYKGIRLEDIANRYGISMWQAAALFQGKNKDYIKKHTLAATNHLAEYDATQMTGSTSWLNGNFIKSYEAMFGVHQDGVWSPGMSSWLTYAMRKQMGKKTDTIFPPWWTLDPLQQAIEDQNKNNADQREFLKDLDVLSSWGFGYLVDKLQGDGVEDGLPVARIAVKNKDLAKQYDDQLKEQSVINSTGTEDFTKFVSAVMAPGIQQGIRSIAQTLGIADFAVVDMYDKLVASGRLKKGERTSRLDKEVSMFKRGLFYAATGGRVPGTGNGDTVPAMLTPGEFVLRKAAVKAIGLDNLYNMNNVQQFATGGPVYSFNEATAGRMRSVKPIRFDGKALSTVSLTDPTGGRKVLDDKKVVNNYTTINNPKAEKSTASINRLLRKKATLGFMTVDDDKVQVNG